MNGSPIWFYTGDEIKGRLHSNGVINISGTPHFFDRVTTSASYVNPTPNSATFDYLGSPEVNQETQTIPSSNSSLSVWAQPAYNNGRNYQYIGETRILLKNNGRMNVSTIIPDGEGGIDQGETGSDVLLPDSGVIYVSGGVDTNYMPNQTVSYGNHKGDRFNGDVYVEGILDGRLTIGAQNNIYITGDLMYEDTSFSDPNSDMLGLVANNYIWILHYWANNTDNPPFPEGSSNYNSTEIAPTDITIHAAMLTVNHSFGFEWHSSGSNLGYINTKGSIAQKFRGPVGTTSGKGYSKNYNYDPRMRYRQPPHYLTPANSGYEIISWKEVTY
ncbi:MAG: hypothetical protein HY779_01435 [Rubrobacteridae bacterium]|nr:hypothetical protein [Rubrobacteridae bacterium]